MENITLFACSDTQGNPGPAVIGVSVADANGVVIYELGEEIGNATHTFATYQAVLRGLQIAKEHFGAKTKELSLVVTLDNELVKQQLSGACEIKEPGLVPHFIEIHNMRVSSFPTITFLHLSHEHNEERDRLIIRAWGM